MSLDGKSYSESQEIVNSIAEIFESVYQPHFSSIPDLPLTVINYNNHNKQNNQTNILYAVKKI